MAGVTPLDAQAVEILHQRLKREADSSGYYLNPDHEFARELVRGLLVNEHRYGYWACPCRLAAGDRARDLDIICPCDYRDADIGEFGACYCALYVSQEVANGRKQATAVPERRPALPSGTKAEKTVASKPWGALPLPVWRCKVCGYLCGRERPPDVCPICKAKKERFERFI